jgi:phosphotriesterase-related protein
MSVEALQEEMQKEIREGIDESGVRAGVIGELGSSEQLHPEERRGLVAAARVNSTLGVPVIVHTEPKARIAVEILEELSKNGADLSKVSLCHMDSDFMEIDYHESILKTGANIEFDTFGENFCLHPNYGPSDLDRVKSLCTLLAKGYAAQLMLGCDICLKCRLHAYGGWGYDHLLSNVIPTMKRLGISDEEIETMLIQNPREFLDF